VVKCVEVEWAGKGGGRSIPPAAGGKGEVPSAGRAAFPYARYREKGPREQKNTEGRIKERAMVQRRSYGEGLAGVQILLKLAGGGEEEKEETAATVP